MATEGELFEVDHEVLAVKSTCGDRGEVYCGAADETEARDLAARLNKAWFEHTRWILQHRTTDQPIHRS